MDEFGRKREAIYFIGMVLGLGLSVMLILFSWMTMVISDDLVGVIETNNQEIAELEAARDYLSQEANRYKMLYEETYELFIDCTENGGAACDQPGA